MYELTTTYADEPLNDRRVFLDPRDGEGWPWPWMRELARVALQHDEFLRISVTFGLIHFLLEQVDIRKVGDR